MLEMKDDLKPKKLKKTSSYGEKIFFEDFYFVMNKKTLHYKKFYQ